jgi:hypothetical protein
MSVSGYLPYITYGGAAAALITILYGLNHALAAASWPAAERTRIVRVTAGVLLGWVSLAIGLSAAGAFHVAADGIPTIQYGIAAPILTGALLIWRSETVARIIEAVPQRFLIGIQVYRALGFIFLVLYASGKLPGLFAWPAGLGDIAIGLLAPVIAFAYTRAPENSGGLVRSWNLLGILDLVIAVSMGFITSPSLFQPITVEPNSELMTVLPMVLIPVFLVPLSIVLHITSLTKLHRETAPNGPMVRASA